MFSSSNENQGPAERCRRIAGGATATRAGPHSRPLIFTYSHNLYAEKRTHVIYQRVRKTGYGDTMSIFHGNREFTRLRSVRKTLCFSDNIELLTVLPYNVVTHRDNVTSY